MSERKKASGARGKSNREPSAPAQFFNPSGVESLEFRIMRLFLCQLYFVRRGVFIYSDQYLNRGTDLDVLAVRFVPPFRRCVEIAECKSGSSRAMDRIFWLSGLRQHVGADDATYVREHTSWDVKEFGARNKVRVLEHGQVDVLERDLGIDPQYWPSWTNQDFLISQQSSWNAYLGSDPESRSLSTFFASEFEWDREIASIRFLLSHMRRLSKQSKAQPNNSLLKALLVECLIHCSLFFLSFCGKTQGQTRDDIARLIHKDLKYGTLDPRVVDRMMRYSMKLTEQVLLSVGVSAERINPADFDYPEPSLVDETIRMYSLFAEHPLTGVDIPSIADYVLTELIVIGRSDLPWLWTFLGRTDVARTLALLDRLCSELIAIDVLPEFFGAAVKNARGLMKARSTKEPTGAVQHFERPLPEDTPGLSRQNDAQATGAQKDGLDEDSATVGSSPTALSLLPEIGIATDIERTSQDVDSE